MLFKENRTLRKVASAFDDINTYEDFRKSGLTFAGGFEGLQAARAEDSAISAGDTNTDILGGGITDIEQQIESAKAAVYTDPTDERNQARKDLIERINNATSDAERASLNSLLSIVNEPTTLETSQFIADDARAQIESAMKARAARQEEIETAPGEAGQEAKSAVGAVTARNARGAMGATAGSSAQQKSLQEIYSKKYVSGSIASDPELQRLSSIITQRQAQLSGIAAYAKTTSQQDALSKEIAQVEALQKVFEGYKTAKEDAQKNTFDFVKSLDANTLAAFDENELTKIFSDAGVSPTMARGVQAAAKRVQEAAERAQGSKDAKDAVELAQAQVDLQQSINDLGSEADKKIQNYQTLERALSNGEITQEAFDSITADMGLAPEKIAPIDAAIKQAELALKNAQTDKAKADAAKVLSDLQDYKSYSATPTGVDVVNVLSTLKSNMGTDDVYKVAGISRTGDAQYYGECAAFVNDVLGRSGYFGSSYDGKLKHRNNTDVLNPTAGSVFISNIGPNGHVGFVESVDVENKTATLYDMNRHGGGQGSRRVVPFDKLASQEGIVGYENLATTAKQEAEYFDESLIPMYAKYEEKDMTSSDWETITNMGISEKQFANQALASKSKRNEMGAQFATEVIALAERLKGFDSAKSFWFTPDPSTLAAIPLIGDVPGTDPYDYQMLFDAFQSKLGLDELTRQKKNGATFGALSNQELNFLTSAATSLKVGASDDERNRELDRVIEKLVKAGGQLPPDVLAQKDADDLYGPGGDTGDLTANDIPD